MTDPLVVANALQPLIDVFEELLKGLHSVIGSWGFAIIGLTLVIRTLLLPLAVVQYRSMKGMAALGPKIKELQEKYKDDRPKLAEEQRKLMSESGVNPAAGCLPLLFQAPVFISLFYMLRKDLKIDICDPIGNGVVKAGGDLTKIACEQVTPGSGKFLFIPDLTDNAVGTVLVVLLVLYVGSQLLSTLLMPSTVTGMQRNIFYALPFLFVPFIINFPAGLMVYWITTNLYTVFQQVTLRRIYGAPGVATDETPVGMIEDVVTEVAARVGPSERPTKRKRTGKRR
ncbi:MAG: membrane protein insertase YidC [Solirubrobacteraceae bacterium]|nr:membrane protein insertase YidC [Solirubrobacteraceae bacterium]